MIDRGGIQPAWVPFARASGGLCAYPGAGMRGLGWIDSSAVVRRAATAGPSLAGELQPWWISERGRTRMQADLAWLARNRYIHRPAGRARAGPNAGPSDTRTEIAQILSNRPLEVSLSRGLRRPGPTEPMREGQGRGTSGVSYPRAGPRAGTAGAMASPGQPSRRHGQRFPAGDGPGALPRLRVVGHAREQPAQLDRG